MEMKQVDELIDLFQSMQPKKGLELAKQIRDFLAAVETMRTDKGRFSQRESFILAAVEGILDATARSIETDFKKQETVQ